MHISKWRKISNIRNSILLMELFLLIREKLFSMLCSGSFFSWVSLLLLQSCLSFCRLNSTLLFFMLKWTKILLYLEQQQKCFTIIEYATSLVQFLKEKKVYKITSRKKPTTDIFNRRFPHVSLQSSKCLFLSCLLSQLSLFLILQFLLYLSDELKAWKAVVFYLY